MLILCHYTVIALIGVYNHTNMQYNIFNSLEYHVECSATHVT